MNETGHGMADVIPSENYLINDSYFTAIAKYIMTCMTPMTMAIQGDLGTGKSTAMKLIQEAIEKEIQTREKEHRKNGSEKTKDVPLYPMIEFNTWQYSKVEFGSNLILSLLLQLSEKVTKCDPDAVEANAELKHAVTTLKKGIGLAAAFAFSMAENVVGSIAENGKDAVLNRMNGATEEKILDVEQLKEQLSRNIESIVHGGRLIVFIDDLDRLEPRQAIELLEGLKVFLDLENCVFVLAMDQKVVFQGIDSKYGKDFGDVDGKGQKFFDKIIQVPVDLPVRQYNLKKYVKQLLQESKLELTLTGEKEKRYVDAVTFLGDRNPRAIKRSLNQLALYKMILQECQTLEESEDRTFYTFVYLLYKKKSDLDVGSCEELMDVVKQNQDLQIALGVVPEDEEVGEEQTEEEQREQEKQRLANKAICQKFYAVISSMKAVTDGENGDAYFTFQSFRDELENKHRLRCEEATENGETSYTFVAGTENSPKKILKVSKVYNDGAFNVLIYKGYSKRVTDLTVALERTYGTARYRYYKYYSVFYRPTKDIVRKEIIPRYVVKPE